MIIRQQQAWLTKDFMDIWSGCPSGLSPLHTHFSCVSLSPDGARVASSTGIDILLLDDFKLVINDATHLVRPPRRGEGWQRKGRLLTVGVATNKKKLFYWQQVDRVNVFLCVCFHLCVCFRAAAPRGGRKAEWRQVSGAAALHHPAHRRAPTRQGAWAHWTAGGPQLSTPPLRAGRTSFDFTDVLVSGSSSMLLFFNQPMTDNWTVKNKWTCKLISCIFLHNFQSKPSGAIVAPNFYVSNPLICGFIYFWCYHQALFPLSHQGLLI